MGKNDIFPRQYRLLKYSDFLHVSNQGCKIFTPQFIFIYYKSELPMSRLGITVSRKIGSAVIRNKIKRFLREFFRKNKSSFLQCYDISIIARKKILFINQKQLNILLTKIIENEFN